MNLEIRPVRPNDAKELRENIYSRDTLEQASEIISQSIAGSKEGRIIHLVALVDGHIAGNIKLIKKTHPFYKHRCELGDVVVNPAFQKRGIAHALFDEVKKHAKEHGFRILETGVRGGTPAETVYRKLGFVEYSRLPNGIVESWADGKEYDEVGLYMNITG